MQTDLARDEHVIAIAQRLHQPETPFEISVTLTLGCCFRFWAWAQERTADGWIPHVSPNYLDDVTGVDGFGEALAGVGWLEVRDDGIRIPDFANQMGGGARARALQARRQNTYSTRLKAGTVTPPSSNSQEPVRTTSRGAPPRERVRERVREEKTPPTPPEGGMVFPECLDNQEFREAWGRWQHHRTEIRHKLTPTTTESQLKSLAKIGPEQAVIRINHTIEMGWQGLRSPSAEGAGFVSDDTELRARVKAGWEETKSGLEGTG